MDEMLSLWFGDDWKTRSLPVPTEEQRKTIMGFKFIELPSMPPDEIWLVAGTGPGQFVKATGVSKDGNCEP